MHNLVFKKKRNVPFAALEQINKELDRLEQSGILSKTDFSKWAAPIVHVKKKSNQIRICADFSTGLNDALQDHHYPLPSPEEIFNKQNGGKIISKMDFSDAYLQIEVDEESSKLLCVNTFKGLYKYNRLAFGVKVAPAIFQQVMDTILGDLDYATAYLDDILVTSKTTAEHRNHIINVFEKLQEYRFKVKEAKRDFFLPEIKYLGHIMKRDGRRPDSERANAIRNMPAPDNVQALQSFLGRANFYQGFIKNMQNLRGPLNELLKKDKPSLWTPECQESFEKILKNPECQESFENIKKTLTSDLSLTHYDPTLDIIVASDARSYGIGACILHRLPDDSWKTVAHASRSLQPLESNILK